MSILLSYLYFANHKPLRYKTANATSNYKNTESYYLTLNSWFVNGGVSGTLMTLNS
jgi:hypothetical protein